MPYLGNYTGAPTTDPSQEKSPYIRDTATPNAFGVNVDQANEGLGRAISGFGSEIGSIANQFQDDYNTAAATDLQNQYNMSVVQRTAEHNQLTGKAALDDQPAYQQFLTDTREKILGGAPNGAVARIAGQRLANINTALSMDSTRHVVAETYRYKQDQLASSIQLGQDQARQDTDNLEKFNANIESVKASTREYFKMSPPETQEVEVKKAVTGAIAQRLDSLRQQGKADQAMAEYEKLRPQIMDDGDKIHDAIYTSQKAQFLSKQSTQLVAGDLPSVKDRENYAMDQLQARVGKIGAAGLVGGMTARESVGLIPTAVNPGDGADGSDSVGIGQWNAERREDLEKFAKAQGTDWRDFKTQVAFIDKELQDHPDIVEALKGAKTPEEAATIANRMYEVSADQPGTAGHTAREKAATRLAAADITPPAPLSPTRVTDLVNTARQEAVQKFPDDPTVAEEAERAVRGRYSQYHQDVTFAKQEAVYNARDLMYAKNATDPNATPSTWGDLMASPDFVKQIDALRQQPGGEAEVRKLQAEAYKNSLNVPPSDERDVRFETLMGMANDDPQRFRKEDLASYDLTVQQRSELHAQQRKMTAISQRPPDLAHAQNVLVREDFFNTAHLIPSKIGAQNPQYDAFMGQFNKQVALWTQQGKKPTDDEIKSTAAMLLTKMPGTGLLRDKPFYQVPMPQAASDAIVQQYRAEHNGNYPDRDTVRGIFNMRLYNRAKNNPEVNKQLLQQQLQKASAPAADDDNTGTTFGGY